MRLVGLLLAAVVLGTGCGYSQSGTWNDDPDNWERAFNSTKPPDVEVVHSYYWRSPHWTYEFEYFFEVAPTPELSAQLFGEENQLVQVGSAVPNPSINHFTEPPAWFVPGNTGGYDVWTPGKGPRAGGNLQVFVDKDNGHLFLTNHQF